MPIRCACAESSNNHQSVSSLAKDSLFEAKKPGADKEKDALSERDSLYIRYIMREFTGINLYSNPDVLETIKRLNQYMEQQKSGIRISLREAVVTLPEGEKKRNIPVVSVPLQSDHEVHYYILGVEPVVPLDQVRVLGLTEENLVSFADEGFGWVGKIIVDKPGKYPDIIKQTVGNRGKRDISPKLVEAAGEVLLKHTIPSYWSKKNFSEFGLLPPAYDLEMHPNRAWNGLVTDLLLKKESDGGEVTNVKYAKAGINKLQVRLYSVPVPREQGGIIQPDGRRVLMYPHLYLERDELEIYVPDFILDEQYIKNLFAKYRIHTISVVNILAQLLDQVIGDEYFGLPEIWMVVDSSRLNLNDFIAVSEAKLCELFLAKERGDAEYLGGFNAAFAAMKQGRLSGVTDPKTMNRIDLLDNEINLLWNDKLLLPTTMKSFELMEKTLTISELHDLLGDPLYARIQTVAKSDYPDHEAISGLILDILKRIEAEFGTEGILSDIRKYARLSYVAYRRKQYEATVNYWGMLQNKMYQLKSPASNLNRELVEKVQRSMSISLFDFLSEYLDRYFAHYIEMNGISSLEPIGGESYIVNGQIRIVKNKEGYDKMCGDASPWEIMVIAHMPDAERPMKKVSGIITAHVGALQSHEATRARAMKIPLAALAHADKLLQLLDGRWVQFTVMGKNASILPFADTGKIEEAKARSIVGETTRKIDIPQADVSTKMNYIHGFDRITSNKTVGNKAYKLAVLKKNMEADDVFIPDADVIPFAAYFRFLEGQPALKAFISETLKTIDKKDSDQINRALSAIRQKIVDTPMPQDMQDEIVRGLTSGIFGASGGRVAVRSSMNVEDLEDEACAGFYDSYLNIRTVDGILLHIKKVWASLWNRTAYNFREVHQISHDLVMPAVIIQKMVSADYSFVIFTANIVGDAADKTNEVVIEMVPGMGESLVGSGAEFPGRPMRFVYDKKKDAVVSYDFGDRMIKMVPDSTGEGLIKKETTPLTDKKFRHVFGMPVRDFVRTLGKKAVLTENIAERPQDIEGTITLDQGAGERRMQVTLTQTRSLSGFTYYPVTDEMVRKRYGKWIDDVFSSVEPIIDSPCSLDQRTLILSEFQEPYAELGEENKRYRAPILRYIFNYKNTGPKVLARCLWYPLSDTHYPTFMALGQLSPRMLAGIYTHMCIDTDSPYIHLDPDVIMNIWAKTQKAFFGNEPLPKWYRNVYAQIYQKYMSGGLDLGDKRWFEIMRELNYDKSRGDKRRFIEFLSKNIGDARMKQFNGLNGYFISRSLLGWDSDYVYQTLKHLRAEKLAMIVKEVSLYYRVLGDDPDEKVREEKQKKENALRDIVGMILAEKNKREVKRFIKTLNDAAKKWIVMRVTLPEGVATQIESASTVIISDRFNDKERVSRLFEDQDVKGKIPIDYITNNNINQESVLHDISENIQPSIIVLNAHSGEAVREFLIWLNHTKISAEIILVAEPGTELPASYYTEYKVKKLIERDASFDRKIFDAVIEIINEIIKAQQAAVSPVPLPVIDSIDRSVGAEEAVTVCQ